MDHNDITSLRPTSLPELYPTVQPLQLHIENTSGNNDNSAPTGEILEADKTLSSLSAFSQIKRFLYSYFSSFFAHGVKSMPGHSVRMRPSCLHKLAISKYISRAPLSKAEVESKNTIQYPSFNQGRRRLTASLSKRLPLFRAHDLACFFPTATPMRVSPSGDATYNNLTYLPRAILPLLNT